MLDSTMSVGSDDVVVVGCGPKRCVWRQEKDFYDDDPFWLTACGDVEMFMDGGPTENHYRFCPYCGKPIVVEESEHDG